MQNSENANDLLIIITLLLLLISPEIEIIKLYQFSSNLIKSS